ncbi:unnamed protein product [Linum tenue]|uniref:Uncharacterized protein n=1 Tax=Linum tenue TaxID=586396 RepID=A0AAV0J3U6_9ROSI|nr:unnamed protein product [Linum tenue]CAI0404461.1 unnamed protein product [Linum tenue]
MVWTRRVRGAEELLMSLC